VVRKSVYRASAFAALVALVIFGCAGSKPEISVRADGTLVDRLVHVRVTGLEAHERVELVAATQDGQGTAWTSRTMLVADGDGDADLGARPMRFLEAMSARPRRAAFVLPTPTLDVRLTLRRGGSAIATTMIRRVTVAADVEQWPVTERGLLGTHFVPPGAGPRPALLLLGGGEGGDATPPIGRLLASHGIEVLTLAYFAGPGLPRHLKRIPLEYFHRALLWLRAQPRVDPRRVGIAGLSRGGELALLLASTWPELPDRVAALVPSAFVFPSAVDRHVAAWTLHGRDVPFGQNERIPVERIPGPVLTVGAGDDYAWESARFVDEIAYHRRGQEADAHIQYEKAGHLVGEAIPYVPVGNHPEFGGFPRPDADARADLWPRLVTFLGGR
jgi:dienelactone hydrolase